MQLCNSSPPSCAERGNMRHAKEKKARPVRRKEALGFTTGRIGALRVRARHASTRSAHAVPLWIHLAQRPVLVLLV